MALRKLLNTSILAICFKEQIYYYKRIEEMCSLVHDKMHFLHTSVH